jgi:hypothetical protein
MKLKKKILNARPWWSPEIESQRHTVRNKRRRYQRCNNSTLREIRRKDYLTEKYKYQKLIKNARNKSWREFVGESKAWDMPYVLAMNKLKIKPILTTIKKPDGTFTDNKVHTINAIMDVLFPKDECHDDTDYHKNIRLNAVHPINTEDDLPFTEQEIKACFDCQNKNKAPGIDNFPADVALNTFLTIPLEVRQIYNSCLEVGYYPKIWKTALLKLINKNNGKKDWDPKSYRPISLLCVFAKVLEKLLINRVYHHFYSNNLINSSQFGFRSQSSTEDAILKIVNKVTERLNIQGFVLLISRFSRGI